MWLLWVEYCYNTSTLSAHIITLYELVYGRSSPTLLSYVKGTTQVEAVEKTLVEHDQLLREARDCLLNAQHRMAQIYKKHHKENHLRFFKKLYSSRSCLICLGIIASCFPHLSS